MSSADSKPPVYTDISMEIESGASPLDRLKAMSNQMKGIILAIIVLVLIVVGYKLTKTEAAKKTVAEGYATLGSLGEWWERK